MLSTCRPRSFCLVKYALTHVDKVLLGQMLPACRPLSFCQGKQAPEVAEWPSNLSVCPA